MMRSGMEVERATSQRMRKRNGVILMRKERTLMMRAPETGSQVLSGSTDKDIIQQLYHSSFRIKVNLFSVFFTIIKNENDLFLESAKGSDSEDDFLRQKSKLKVATDSDSDSDVGTKKGKKPHQHQQL